MASQHDIDYCAGLARAPVCRHSHDFDCERLEPRNRAWDVILGAPARPFEIVVGIASQALPRGRCRPNAWDTIPGALPRPSQRKPRLGYHHRSSCEAFVIDSMPRMRTRRSLVVEIVSEHYSKRSRDSLVLAPPQGLLLGLRSRNRVQDSISSIPSGLYN